MVLSIHVCSIGIRLVLSWFHVRALYVNVLQVPLQWGEEGQDVLKGEETGHRLAVCNMDWDKISAQDLYGGWSSGWSLYCHGDIS